jgi:hypothetical protein
MIRNLMLGMSLVTLSSVSAFAGTPAATHHAKANVVAQAPAADAPAPATDKPVKKSTAKKAPKKAKTDAKSDAKTEIKSGSSMGSSEIAPAPEAPKAK